MAGNVVLLWALMLAAVGTTALAKKDGKPLTLAVFLNGVYSNQSEYVGGQTYLIGLQLSLELLNNDTRLLPGYFVNATIQDDQCTGAYAVRGLYEDINNSPDKIMVIGFDCSVAATPVATLAPYWNLAVISYGATSPVLQDTSAYPSFLRVVSSDDNLAIGIGSLMKYFGWTTVAAVVQEESIFLAIRSKLRTVMKDLKLNDPLEYTFLTGEDTAPIITRLSNAPTRIIFIDAYPSYVLEVLCQCYHLKVTAENGYIFIIFGHFQWLWWDNYVSTHPNATLNCTQAEIDKLVTTNIYINHLPYVPDSELNIPTDILGMTRAQYDSLLQQRLAEKQVTSSQTLRFVPFITDAIWMAGIALNATQGERYALENFTYNSNDISGALYRNAKNAVFRGMTGTVSLVGNQRIGNLRFIRYYKDSSGVFRESVFGTLDSNGTFRLNESIETVFPYGVPKAEEFVHIPLALFIVYTIVSILGILLGIGIIVFNLVFARNRIIKFSSPYLNVVTVIGTILFYVEVILFGIDEGTAPLNTVSCLCMVHIWIAVLSFTLVFGTIFAKTWRVYYIFSHARTNKKVIKKLITDAALFGMISCALVIDLIFLIIITAVPSTRLVAVSHSLPQSGPALPHTVHVCSASSRVIWIVILFAYKGVFLVIGVFLAWETRAVHFKHLNDSRPIGASIYGIVVISIALAAISVLLEDAVGVVYGAIGALLLLGNTSLLCLIFAPKVYAVWKNTQEKDISTNDDMTTNQNASKDNTFMTQLQMENTDLKKQLAELRRGSEITTTLNSESFQASGDTK